MEKDVILLKTLFLKSYELYKDKKHYDSCNLISQTSEIWMEYKQRIKFMTLLGMNYLKTNELEKAERVLIECIAISDNNIRILDLLGQVYFYQERYIESEKAFLYAKRQLGYDFTFSLKMAKTAWKSGNFNRMFKRLRGAYIPQLITSKEEKKLKKFLIDFLQTSNFPDAYVVVKKFRAWCSEKKKSVYINKG